MKRLVTIGTAMLLVLVAMTTWASAQDPPATVNPRQIEFAPSADHEATLPGGSPAVTRYELEIWAPGATAPESSVDLGKPEPSDGLITMQPGLLIAMPVGREFRAIVAAIGPGGMSRSEPSNPFVRSGPPAPAGKPTLR